MNAGVAMLLAAAALSPHSNSLHAGPTELPIISGGTVVDCQAWIIDPPSAEAAERHQCLEVRGATSEGVFAFYRAELEAAGWTFVELFGSDTLFMTFEDESTGRFGAVVARLPCAPPSEPETPECDLYAFAASRP